MIMRSFNNQNTEPKQQWKGVRAQVCCRLAVLAMLLGLINLTGCTTPETRIRENQELFASFPADAQAKVRQGHVEVGFTKDMVLLAQGEPDRRIASKNASGTVSESWIYTDVYYTHVPVYHSHRYHRRHYDDCDSYYFDRAWDDVPHEYDRLTLRFEDHRVVSLDIDER